MFYSEACNNDERENDEESEDEGGSVSNLPTVSLKKYRNIGNHFGNIGKIWEYWENMGIFGNIRKVR